MKLLETDQNAWLYDHFCYIEGGTKVHISYSGKTMLLRCGRQGTHPIGLEYTGPESDICRRCLASYRMWAEFQTARLSPSGLMQEQGGS